MVKNSLLSVKIKTLRTRFYGQMLQKQQFVRKLSELVEHHKIAYSFLNLDAKRSTVDLDDV